MTLLSGIPRLSSGRARNFALLLALSVAPLAAQTSGRIDADFLSRGPSVIPRIWKAFQQVPLPPANLTNRPRLAAMIHDQKLEITLNDFLKLVIDDAMDIEVDRYNYLIAQTDLLRARSGQAARGLPLTPVPADLFAGAIGAGVGNTANVSTAGTGAAAITAAARAVVVGPRGNFDPTFSANFSFDRVISPLNTVRVSGSPTVTVPTTVLQTRFQQELPFGTSYSLTFNLQRQSSTQKFLIYNPAFNSLISFQVYQPLLNGFGLALNRRFITVTENNRKINREFFSQELNTSLTNAANLYWDLVALREQVKVAQQSLEAAQKLYDDNQKQVAAGALAPLDLVQTESQLAASRRDLVTAQTNEQMQETRIKSAISRNFTPELDAAQIETLDPLPQPGGIEVPSLSTAVQTALANRAVIRQVQLQRENQRIAEAYTHNNLLPVLSAFAQFNSYALSEGTNSMFRQMAQWEYPEYSVGLSLTISIFNRAAQADSVRSRLELQQAAVTLDQTRSQVGVAVRTAVVGLIQSRAQIEAAQRAVANSEQALRGQQVRFQNGISTPYQVILAQRDLLTAQSAEIQTRVNAAKALIALQSSVGSLFTSHDISVDDALRGDLFTGSTRP